MSTTALLTAWVGATVPLLPAVALVIGIAGRNRSATRWLNSLAIVVAAVFLAAQIIIALVFGSVLVKGLTSLTDRGGDDVAVSAPFVAEEEPAPVEPAPSVDPTAPVAPGGDATTDAQYIDLIASSMEESGEDASAWLTPDNAALYKVASNVCSGLDAGSDFDAVTELAAEDLPVSRANAGAVSGSAIFTYCPQHSDLLGD